MSHSAEQTGAAGFTYEDEVNTSYLAMLLAQTSAPGMDDRVVTGVAFQQKIFGKPMDDLIVDGKAKYSEHRLSLQTKRKVRFVASDENLRDIVKKGWETLCKDDFRCRIDRFGFVVHDIIADDKRDMNELCELARATRLKNFKTLLTSSKGSSRAFKKIYQTIESHLTEVIGHSASFDELHKFLSHFLCINIDFPYESSTFTSTVINVLRNILAPQERDDAPKLRSVLKEIARLGDGRYAEFDRDMLMCHPKIYGHFLFRFYTQRDVDEKQDVTKGAEDVYSTLHGLPFGPEYNSRKAWPENLLMRIGVDRTCLLGVVSGIEAQSLYQALRFTEHLVDESDKEKKFGRRQWFCVEPEWPQIDNDSTVRGYVWNISDDVSVNDMKEAIHICWSGSIESTNEQRAEAGNILIAVVNDKDDQYVEQIRCHFVEQLKALGVTVSVCGWSVGQATQLTKAVADSAAGEKRIGTACLDDFEWEIVRTCYDSQKVDRRNQALGELRQLSLTLRNEWQPLCDWVCQTINNTDFFAQANLKVYQLAGLAGLLTGDGLTLTSEQSAQCVEIVKAITDRPELSLILGTLPVCSQVLAELVSCNARCRAVVGLVTAEELNKPVKPWIGYPIIDDWRNGRLLIF